mgnify:FL=1
MGESLLPNLWMEKVDAYPSTHMETGKRQRFLGTTMLRWLRTVQALDASPIADVDVLR